jgi:thiopurine S-methyltransferase
MQPDFWLERWARGETGFHLPTVNPHLQRHWPAFGLLPGARVLVPLAGKSVDLAWLRAQGCMVTAVELSRHAADSLFADLGETPQRTRTADFEVFEVPGLRFFVGDFFRMTPALAGPLDAVYDRAALIALPANLRPAYAAQLTSLQRAGTRSLLVALEYPPTQMNGPPFTVTAAEIAALFGASHTLEELACEDILDAEPRFRARGVTQLVERVFALRRRD